VESVEVGTEPGWCDALVGGGNGSNDLDWLYNTKVESCEC